MAKTKNGLNDYARQMKVLAKVYPKAMQRFAVHETENLKNEIVKRTPVDTGRLRAAFHSAPPKYDGAKWTLTVTNNVEYAEYVEYGHRWASKNGNFVKLDTPDATNWGFVKGRFMVRDGTKAAKNGMNKRYSDMMRKLLDRVNKGGSK